MSTYPNLKNDPKLIIIRTKDDEIKDLKYKAEKHDHENILKSLEIDNEYNKKKYKKLSKKKVKLFVTEILTGSGSAISTSTMGLINTAVGIVLTSSTALLTSIAILITDEYFDIFIKRYTKLRGWIHVITLLFEKTLKEPLIDKRRWERS